jgi:hypothetical protein
MRLVHRLATLAVSLLLTIATVASAQPPRLAWQSIGPDGGQVNAIAIDPSNASRMFVGSPGGGIWKSTDAGASWAPVQDRLLPTSIVNCLVFRPGDPSTLFACVSDVRAPYTGLLKSTDGGETWAALASAGAAGLRNIGALAISANGLAMIAIGPACTALSANGGATWSSCGLDGNAPVSVGVTFLPGSNTRAVLAGPDGGRYTTDAGATWLTSAGPANAFHRTSLGGRVAVSAGAPNTVYYLEIIWPFSISTPPPLYAGVWKSVDGGEHYDFGHVIESGLSWSNMVPVGSFGAIWADPVDGNTVVAGVDNLYRSIDGAQTWTKISDGTLAPHSATAGQRAIAADPRYDGTANRRVYVGTDGGVFKADNVATITAAADGGFTALNAGLSITKFVSGAGSPSSGIVIGSAWTGIWQGSTQTGGAGWTRIRSNDDFSGEGKRGQMGPVAIDPSDSRFLYGPPGPGFYQLSRPISRSIDGGAHWTYLFGPAGTNVFVIRELRLDPNDPKALVAGGTQPPTTGLERFTGLDTPQPAMTLMRNTGASSIAIAPGNSNLVWVDNGGGVLSVTHNATAAQPVWETPGSGPPVVSVTRIAIDPLDNERVLVAFGQRSAGNVWRTTDGGATWTNASGAGSTALPAVPVRSLAIHPRNSSLIYAGTDQGLYSSRDGGATWREDGPALVSVTDLFWMDTRLVAVTDGRGMFSTSTLALTLDDPRPGQTLAPAIVVRGWTLDQSAASGSGVDAVHVYAFPNPGSGAPPVFLGSAAFVDRDDVAAAFGDRYRHTGFELTVGSLAPGPWMIVASARSTVTGSFDLSRAATFTVVGPESRPAMAIDAPSGTVVPHFVVSGWALDAGSGSTGGVDAVHVYASPAGGGPAVFLGATAPALRRWDVALVYGARFADSGYTVDASGLAAGDYTLIVYAHSAVSGAWFGQTRAITVREAGRPAMSLDTPAGGTTIGQPFLLAGWAIDLDAPGAQAPGVDAVHVWAIPAGGGGAQFVGAATLGGQRTDVGAAFGSPFTFSGYNLTVSGLALGDYTLVVYARSVVSGSWSSRTRAITVREAGRPAMSLETPTDSFGTTAGQPFALAGWAVDLDALESQGPGVDVLHVWALPAAGGAPAMFLGAASTGGLRGDVGAAFGPQFATAGYNMTISGLGPGTYQLVVYAHSTVTNTFNQSRVVRVTMF